jgi:uncharacterized protein YggE
LAAVAEIDIERCDARMVGISVQDFFDQSKQKVTARTGAYQLEIVIRPIDEVGGVLAVISEAVGDALQVRGIQLEIEDLEPLKSEARRLAIEDAKKKAVELSGEAGVRLGAVLSIQSDTEASVPFAQRMKLSSGSFAASNLPIEAGSVSTASSVTLIYLIEE